MVDARWQMHYRINSTEPCDPILNRLLSPERQMQEDVEGLLHGWWRTVSLVYELQAYLQHPGLFQSNRLFCSNGAV